MLKDTNKKGDKNENDRVASHERILVQKYRIYSAIRQGFSLSRMTTNNKISPVIFLPF